MPNKEFKCRKCFIPAGFPGLSINSDGSCNFCVEFEKMENVYKLKKSMALNEIEKLKEAAANIKKYAKENNLKYDCIVGASGGFDSSYVLYVAKKIMDLNPLAIKYDNGFCHEMSNENLKKACDILGVDLKIIPSIRAEKRYIENSIKAMKPLGVFFTICFSCHYIVHAVAYKAARENKIKYVLVSKNDVERGLDNVPKEAKVGALKASFSKLKFLDKLKVLFYFSVAQLYLIKLKFKFDGFSKDFLKNALSHYSPVKPSYIEFVNITDYLAWNFAAIEDVIREEISWDTPRQMKVPYMRFDCHLASLVDLSFKQTLGITKRGLLHNWFIQAGLISRQEFMSDMDFLEDEQRLQNDAEKVFKKISEE